MGLKAKIVLIGKKGITYFNRRQDQYDIVGTSDCAFECTLRLLHLCQRVCFCQKVVLDHMYHMYVSSPVTVTVVFLLASCCIFFLIFHHSLEHPEGAYPAFISGCCVLLACRMIVSACSAVSLPPKAFEILQTCFSKDKYVYICMFVHAFAVWDFKMKAKLRVILQKSRQMSVQQNLQVLLR